MCPPSNNPHYQSSVIVPCITAAMTSFLVCFCFFPSSTSTSTQSQRSELSFSSSSSSSQSQYVLCYSTVPTKETAAQLSTWLVEQKLVACVTVSQNVTSIYRWEGAIEHSSEYLLMMKAKLKKKLGDQPRDESLHHQQHALIKAIQSKHPYKVPEVVCVPFHSAADSYLQWIDDNSS